MLTSSSKITKKDQISGKHLHDINKVAQGSLKLNV